MYNKVQKIAFITYYKMIRVLSVNCVYAMFNKIGDYEEKAQKDCSEFSKKEIIEMYKGMKAKSYNTILTYNSILRAYTAFVYDDQNYYGGYGEVSLQDTYDCIDINDLVILSREQVDDIERSLMNASDKAVIECLFEGIMGKGMSELTSITADMIDDDTLILHLKTKDVQLTPKLYEYLQAAFDENIYCPIATPMNSYELEPGRKLYKYRLNFNNNKKDEDSSRYRWVSRKIVKIKQELDMPWLDAKKLHLSGAVYYITNGMEQSGLELRPFLKSKEGETIVQKYGYSTITGCYNAVYPYII